MEDPLYQNGGVRGHHCTIVILVLILVRTRTPPGLVVDHVTSKSYQVSIQTPQFIHDSDLI